MVSVETGDYVRRRVPKSEFTSMDSAEQARIDDVLKRLVEARLVVTDNFAGGASLELAHDALILSSTRLRTWVGLDAPRITALRRLTTDAGQWDHARQANDLLWSDAARGVVVQDLLSAEYPGLTPIERDFAHASQRRSQWNRWLRRATFAGLASLTLIAAGIAALYRIGGWQAEIDRLLSAARAAQTAGDSARSYAFSLAALDKTDSWLPSGDRRTAAEGVLNSLINRGIPQIYQQFETTFRVSLSDTGAFIATVGRTKGNAEGNNTVMIGPPNYPENKTLNGPYLSGAFRLMNPLIFGRLEKA
jgi:hypothetical protein